jgi:hypothetical protein
MNDWNLVSCIQKNNHAKLPFPKGVIVQVQEKGWFDDKIMRDWLAVVFDCLARWVAFNLNSAVDIA